MINKYMSLKWLSPLMLKISYFVIYVLCVYV